MPATSLAEAFEQARSLDAPLGERLAAYARATRELNAPFAEAVDRLIGRLKTGAAADACPKEGEAMPPFLLPDHTGRLVSLEDLITTGPLVVTFARGHWCPYCRIAISALAEIAPQAQAVGCNIVVIVPDQQSYAARLRAETAAPFSILTDVDNGYALALGLVFWVGDEMQRLMLARGANPALSQGNDSWFLPIPATFVVAQDGLIKARHVDPDYRTRMELLSLLDILRDLVRN
jgi:peroxiredoxin